MNLDDPFDALLGYHLRRASVAVMADLAAALAPLGLKPVEASILLTIAVADGITQAEIGRALGIQRANMAPIMAGLIKRGLVARQAADGRSQSLRLTAAGQTTHQQAASATKAHEHRLFGRLPAPDRQRLMRQLKAIWQSSPGIDLNNDRLPA
jgi:DNA-binding MarR family transcriptional regulator